MQALCSYQQQRLTRCQRVSGPPEHALHTKRCAPTHRISCGNSRSLAATRIRSCVMQAKWLTSETGALNTLQTCCQESTTRSSSCESSAGCSSIILLCRRVQLTDSHEVLSQMSYWKRPIVVFMILQLPDIGITQCCPDWHSKCRKDEAEQSTSQQRQQQW